MEWSQSLFVAFMVAVVSNLFWISLKAEQIAEALRLATRCYRSAFGRSAFGPTESQGPRPQNVGQNDHPRSIEDSRTKRV